MFVTICQKKIIANDFKPIKAMVKRTMKTCENQIETETISKIKEFIQWGVKPTHQNVGGM